MNTAVESLLTVLGLLLLPLIFLATPRRTYRELRLVIVLYFARRAIVERLRRGGLSIQEDRDLKTELAAIDQVRADYFHGRTPIDELTP